MRGMQFYYLCHVIFPLKMCKIPRQRNAQMTCKMFSKINSSSIFAILYKLSNLHQECHLKCYCKDWDGWSNKSCTNMTKISIITYSKWPIECHILFIKTWLGMWFCNKSTNKTAKLYLFVTGWVKCIHVCRELEMQSMRFWSNAVNA